MKKLIVAPVVIVGLFLLVKTFLRPVPIQPEEELIVHEGVVKNIYESHDKDIFFTVEPSMSFYINRGIERGLKVNLLKAKLVGEKVTFKYPEYKSIFGNGSVKHVSVVKWGDETIFSEIEQTSVETK